MIDFVEGIVVEKQPTRAVIACGGIGYEVFIPLTTHGVLPPAGDHVRLLTVLHVRDDAHLLYGFATGEDREMFRLLIGVAGVGPKIALAALSRLAAADLASAIASEDVTAIRGIPGVGSKLATRIATELRDTVLSDPSVAMAVGTGSAQRGASRDAELALVALGYRPEEARKAVAEAVRTHATACDDVDGLIRLAISR